MAVLDVSRLVFFGLDVLVYRRLHPPHAGVVCDVTALVAAGGTAEVANPAVGSCMDANPWPALHGCMAGSGDGSGDEVRFGTVSLDLFGGLPCRALPPGEGDLKARVSLVCDPPLVTIH